MTSTRRLYQFPLSLYCEKTRWNLDCKGLAWEPVNLLPGLHAPLAWWLARQRPLPILADGAHRIGDSTTIALYLDAQYPAQPLLPDDPGLRRDVLALEDYFDAIGDHVRRCVWSLAVGSAEVSEIFFFGYCDRQQRLGRFMRPLLRLMIHHTFKVYPERVAASWAQVDAALTLVETRLAQSGSGYLAGDRFTLADLTAAAMLAPLIGPAQSPWPDERVASGTGISTARTAIRQRPAAQWVLDIYARHRRRPVSLQAGAAHVTR